MSARRRAARAAQAGADLAESDVLTLLRDPDAPVWRDRARWLELMEAQGWEPGIIGWFEKTHPGNRRNATATAWGVENGIEVDGWPGHADWHRLRAMGLIA